MKKLIIIPAYNEEANIVKTVESIERDAVGFDYIVINDCSTDRTKEICEEHGFHYVDLPINLGIGGAVRPAINMHGRTGMTWQCRWTAMGSTIRNFWN